VPRGPGSGTVGRHGAQRVRPPYVADERTQLLGWLDLQRAIVHYKCEGLSAQDAHRSVLPDSPLMTMAGLVSHLRWTEHCWFDVLFLGQSSAENPQFQDEPEDGDMMVDDIPLAQLLEEYDQQCEQSNRIVAEHSLDDIGKNQDFAAGGATLRWILIHMVDETARHAGHAGHADIIRELVDGGKGYY
jgi:uncharacterized damage-inducible protein DinB